MMDYWPQGNGYDSYKRNRNLTRHFRIAMVEKRDRYRWVCVSPSHVWVFTTPNSSDGVAVIAVDRSVPVGAGIEQNVRTWLQADFKPPVWRELRGTESAYEQYLEVVDEALLFYKLERGA